MFSKLLKYDFRASKGILGILTMVVLGVFVLATLAIKAIVVGANSDSDLAGAATMAAIPILFLAFFAIFAYIIASEILLLVQFYKNKFTDEGYLTFTLPTNVHSIYLSSLLNMLIWQAIIMVTVIVGLLIFALFGTSPDQFVNTSVFQFEIPAVLKETLIAELGWTAFDGVVLILRGIISTISTVILNTTCITLGATLSRKHKVLAAVGIYFGVSCVVSIITSVVSFGITMNAVYVESSMGTVMDLNGILETAINLVILVGGYFLSTGMMKKKLNLP